MRKDRQVLSLDFTRWEEGDMNNYLLVKLWDQCVGEVYKNKQRRISHGVQGRKTEHLDQEKGQKEEPDSSRASRGRPGNKVQDEQFTAVTRNTAGLEDHVEMVTEESKSSAVLREKVFRKSQISESTWNTITKVKKMKIKGGEED